MSSRPYDNYPTPQDEVARGLRRLALDYPRFKPASMIEPGSGKGVFCSTVRTVFPTVVHTTAVDIRSVKTQDANEQVRADFLEWEPSHRFDLVATNPPYSCAESFITRSMQLLAPGGLSLFLLRLDFLGSEGRMTRLWPTVGLRAVWVIPWRVKFVNGKSDRYSSAWFLLDGQRRGRHTFDWIK